MNGDRNPVNVHCQACSHEWPAVYAPIDMTKFAEILKRTICPNCGERKRIFMGTLPRELNLSSAVPIENRYYAWVGSGDTGVSSKAIATKMRDEPVKDTYCHPSDAQDLGRCLRLLALIPEWSERIGEMATISGEWAALTKHWSELAALHSDYEACTKRMRELVRPIEDKRKNLIRLGDGVTLRFGA